MNIELARQMARTAIDANRPLQAIMPRLKTELSEADYTACAHDLARAIDQVNTALLSRAIAAHPALETEIDTAIRTSGRF